MASRRSGSANPGASKTRAGTAQAGDKFLHNGDHDAGRRPWVDRERADGDGAKQRPHPEANRLEVDSQTAIVRIAAVSPGYNLLGASPVEFETLLGIAYTA